MNRDGAYDLPFLDSNPDKRDDLVYLTAHQKFISCGVYCHRCNRRTQYPIVKPGSYNYWCVDCW